MRARLITISACLIVCVMGAPAFSAAFSDAFGRPDGALSAPWVSTASSWGIRAGKARVLAQQYTSTTATATIDIGVSTNFSASADITLSPTRERANGGLTVGFVDYRNNFFCKIEVTSSNRRGLMSIGRKLGGATSSLLAKVNNTGFVVGQTYHVACIRSGNRVMMTVGRRTISYTLVAADAALGASTKVGLRSHMAPDEDDGGTTYDNFVVGA